MIPPEIRYGEDICAACGMIVSDDRFAAALIHAGEAGREPLVFDDIGCLFMHERKQAIDVLAEFVRAADGAGWLELEEAFYIHSTAIETPMAFGIAAYPSAEDAEAARRPDATSFDFDGLRQWIEDDPAVLDPFGAMP